jgi:hypothetical protein
MAEHKVQLPDNSIITIEGPEDATDQELMDVASKHYANKQAQNSGPISAIASGVDKAKNMDALTYGAGAAGLAGLGALGLGKSLKDKFFSSEKPMERIEPQMDVSQQKPREPFLEPETQTVRPTDWESSLNEEDRKLLERSRANAAVKAAQPMQAPAPTAAPSVAPVAAAIPEISAPANPKVPALLQAPAGAVVPPATAAPVPAPVLPTTPIKTEIAPVETVAKPTTETQPVAQAVVEKPAKAPKVQTEEQRIAGAKNWFVSHFGGKTDPQAHAAYDRLVNEVLKGKPPMMGPGGGVPPEFNEFKKWYETNLRGPAKPSREALKAAISSVPKGAVAPPSLRPNEIGQGGGSLIRSLTDPLQLKQ